MASRRRIRARQCDPPGVTGAASTLVLALASEHMLLARAGATRKRRAWWLAVRRGVAAAIAHLAKGLDFEESTTTPDSAWFALFRKRPPVRPLR